MSESKELLSGTPGTQKLRKRLLLRASTYYQEFVKEHARDDKLLADLVMAL